MGSLALEKLNRRFFFSSSSTTDPYEYELLSSPDDSSSSTNSLPSYSSPTLTSPPRRTSPPHPSNPRLSPLRRKFQSHSKLRYLSHFCSLRRFAYFILSIPFFLAIGVLWSGIPSSYDSIKEYEHRLPQHNNSLPFPEGSGGKYLRFANGIWGHGWNNVLQEILVHSHLSHALHRSYVFEPYTWSHTFFPWTIYDFALRPAQIPLNAFISGPSAGGDMPHPRSVNKEYWEGVCGKRSDLVRNGEPHAIVWVGKGDEVMVEVEIVGASDGDPSLQVPSTLAKNSSSSSSSPAPPFAPDPLRPRSVTNEGAKRSLHSSLWPRASKNPSRRVTWGRLPREQEGDVILKWWFDRLSTLEERCIEIRGGPMFDQFLFGSPRILSLWPSLRTSPPITHFSWSPLVQAGVTRNLHRVLPPNDASSISPASLFPPPTPSRFPTLPTALRTSRQQSSQEYNPAPLSSLLALHIRRGDYIRHCPRLARWGATFLGFNSFPSFGSEELFKEPDFLSLGGREEYYRKRCWPSVEEVVRKLRRVREEWEGGSNNTSHHHEISQSTRDSNARTLRHLYLMTNGWPSFVSELRHALLADGWETLTSSLDVERGLDSEQKWVAMAVDMAVAERAAVLVGNGFSSLTSNIVMLRMAKGMDPESHHFW